MYRFPYFIKNKWFKVILIRSKERKEIIEKYFSNFLNSWVIKALRIFSKMKESREKSGKLSKYPWYVLSIWDHLFK